MEANEVFEKVKGLFRFRMRFLGPKISVFQRLLRQNI